MNGLWKHSHVCSCSRWFGLFKLILAAGVAFRHCTWLGYLHRK